jgi:hypothetical protein
VFIVSDIKIHLKVEARVAKNINGTPENPLTKMPGIYAIIIMIGKNVNFNKLSLKTSFENTS